MANTITIKQLFELCKEQVAMGNGSKKILISNDDEGNGYHELFFGFSKSSEVVGGSFPPQMPFGVNESTAKKSYIILG